MAITSPFFFGSSQFYPYEISSSCRFNREQESSMSRTFASAGNQKVYTFATWIKLNDSSSNISFFTAGADAQNKTEMGLQSSAMRFENEVSNDRDLKDSLAVLRDKSQWYHLVFAIDLTQGTNNDKVKMYINGTLQTEFGSENDTFANVNSNINAAAAHAIGERAYSDARHLPAYMAETHFIDGSQLAASSFGETKEDVWIPKEYTGSYGTNGFYLKFNQTGSGTPSASTRGADSSGNDNHFSTTNINAADCNRPDTPTNNFCKINPLSDVSDIGISIGDTNLNNSTDSWPTVRGTFGPTSGKWYYEVDTTDQSRWGAGWATGPFINGSTFADSIADSLLAYSEDPLSVYDFGTKRSINGSPAFDTSDILQVAIDIDAGKFWLGINNTWVNNSGGSAGDPASGTNELETFTAGTQMYPSFVTNGGNLTINFGVDSSFNTNKTAQGNSDQAGHGDFFYTPPAGFLALCSKNLPEPEISPLAEDKPADYFNTVLYTGNGSSQNVSGLSFQPDWVWIKSRSSGNKHKLYDAVRGVEKTLSSSGTSAESTESTTLTEFRSDGFAVGSNDAVNKNTDSMVAWNWLGANGTASNSDGDITSTVSANTTAGFSIVTWTHSGGDGQTIGHGLGATPSCIIAKNRSTSGAWVIGQSDGSFNWTNEYYQFDSAAKRTDGSGTVFGASPTSSLFTFGTAAGGNGDNHLAYCFAEVEGYSKFGSFTGNGSSGGPFVFTGFRPAWLMWKRTNDTNQWIMKDATRDPVNPTDQVIYANLNDADSTSEGIVIDLVSNGFKLRSSTAGNANTSGSSYIYMAFAEMPFKYANAR